MQQQLITSISDRLFLGFGLSMILILILSLSKSENLKEFTSKFINHAIVIIKILGIIYLVYYFISLILYYNSDEVTLFNTRATGPYAWAYWMMLLRPLIFCGLTQLFWIKRIKKSKKLTLILVILILLTTLASGANFERFVIIITSLHRNYLPNSWDLNNSVYDFSLLFILLIIENIILFSALVFLTWFFSERVLEKQISSNS